MSSDVNARQAQKLGVQYPSLSQASKMILVLVCEHCARAWFEIISTAYFPSRFQVLFYTARGVLIITCRACAQVQCRACAQVQPSPCWLVGYY
jgi:hypothetical protein